MAEYITLDQLGAQQQQEGGYLSLDAVKKLSRAEIESQVQNDAISQGARSFPGEGVSGKYLSALGGAVRGAGSIGATLMRPFESAEENKGRRQSMDDALTQLGADPNSLFYKGGKLTAEVAGTAGAGNLIARPLQALSATRYASGLEPVIDGVVRGLQTGGFRVGELAGTGAGAATRLGTGYATGYSAAGLVNPEDRHTGGAIGALLPGATQLAGRAGAYIRGAADNVPAEKLATARRSMEAGYTIPPSQVNPSFRNRTIESLSGKYETAQLASTKNQEVTNSLVRKALGMADDAPLNQETMRQVRQQAGQVYQQLKGTGTVTADKQFVAAIDDIAKTVKSATASFPQLGKTNMHGQPVDEIGQLVSAMKQPQFGADGAVDAISVLRENADAAFRAGNNQLGKANKQAAKALEDMLDRHLQKIGATDMLPAYRNARQLIAKTYTVEKGLREGAGTVDARALARELQKKKPLTGELRTVAEFGNVFDKAAQPPHMIGSPGVNALKPIGSMMTSGLGAAAMGPGGLALGALNYALPPVARAYMFSKGAQRGLLGSGTALLDDAVPMGLLTQGAYRALPVLSAQ